MGGPEKRPADEETGGTHEAKRPSTDGSAAPAETAPAAAPASCTVGGSSMSGLAAAGTKPSGGCTWGSTGGGGFAAIGSAAGFGSSAPTGFGAVSGGGFGAAAAGSGFGFGSGGFGGGTGASGATTAIFGSSGLNPNAAEFVPKPLGADFGSGGGDASGDGTFGSADGEAESESQEPSLLVGSGTGEEGEMCAHRVRAKLFRLESRDKEAGKEGDAGGGEAGDTGGGTSGGAAGTPAAAGGVVGTGDGTGDGVGAEAADGAGHGARGVSEPPSSKEAPSKPGVPAAPAGDNTGGGSPHGRACPATSGGGLTRWVERGVGQVRLLVPEGGGGKSFPRLVMRVENVGRLIMNEPLLPTTAPAVRASDTSVRLALVSASLQPQSYLFRVKMPGEADALLRAINAHIPSASA